ncbi:PREDICTED: serine/threonine-protein phosphatase 7 long form homolog isoform X4 [Nelumbo nucifera]|uniref:Serine/threonine-protein phosphatase 7 long form homolog isoform X4 n=1 Tax=Nelumbo nucifera TaxID=4432 RepID=A0A1U8Q1H5_NELNU|nr:PREDICTED: serine/threonine-protein phosphatase 7 long form homolog isoform X4 [Nelumbo nucifera]
MVVNISTKFTVSSFVKRVEKLSDNQRNAIKRMGFSHLLVMPNQNLSKTLLAELIERWNCEKKAFELPPGEIKATLMDIALILGIRVTGEPVVLTDEPFSELEKVYGSSSQNRQITVASLERRLQSLSMVTNEEFIRTFILFIFGALLFPNADGTIDSRYLYFLKDLDKVPHFAWGEAVLRDLYFWLDRRKRETVEYMGSCLIFLQIWSYEHIDIARPIFQGSKLSFPRACRWKNSTSYTRQWFTTKFENLKEKQVIKLEESEDIVGELLEAQKDNLNLPTSQLSPTIASIENEDSLRTRNQILEKQNLELKKEVDFLRKENQNLRSQLSSVGNLADRLERILFDGDVNKEKEETSTNSVP